MRLHTVVTQVITHRPYFRYFLLLWFVTVSMFLWFVNINLLAYIWNSSALTLIGKMDFTLDAYVNFFIIDNPVSLSRAVFSLLLAINLTLMVFLWKTGKERKGAVKNNGGALVLMVGSHCVACGTAVAAPLITALAGSSGAYYFSAERFAATQLLATSANLLGVILIVWSIRSMTRRIIMTKLLEQPKWS